MSMTVPLAWEHGAAEAVSTPDPISLILSMSSIAQRSGDCNLVNQGCL